MNAESGCQVEIRQPSGCGGTTTTCSKPPATYKPAIDVVETSDEFRIVAEMPGVSAENLDVQFEKGQLTLEGRVQQSEPATYHRHEFRRGNFRRVLSIRAAVDADEIAAELKNGLLTIRLPKSARARAKKITIET